MTRLGKVQNVVLLLLVNVEYEKGTAENKRRVWTAYLQDRDVISCVRHKNDLGRLTRELRREFEQQLVDRLRQSEEFLALR